MLKTYACSCGKSHSFGDLNQQRAHEENVLREGDIQQVNDPMQGKTYIVDRVFLVFHGVNPAILEELLQQGKIQGGTL